ncbi:hypothetical protein AAEX28_15075 [Lentisphaerota bacterium WC36G]|nr:hypothetical protein LJT99_01830 [Lentisphaerae bacterium WC36]
MSNNSDIRLYIEKKCREAIDTIFNEKKLGLNHLENIDRFMWALALGIMKEEKKPLTGAKDSFIRRESISTRNESQIIAHYISTIDENVIIDQGIDIEEAFKQAGEYANAGFDSLESLINNFSLEDVLLKKLQEITEYYENIDS